MTSHVRRGWIALVSVMTFLGALAGVALALWASSTQTIYSQATLGGAGTRVDTVVVSNVDRSSKQDRFVIALAGTGAAATADSQFYAVVKAIREGQLYQIGEDSLRLRPDPPLANTQTGEVRVLRWVADSLQITTVNPKSTSVTGARLTITPTRAP